MQVIYNGGGAWERVSKESMENAETLQLVLCVVWQYASLDLAHYLHGLFRQREGDDLKVSVSQIRTRFEWVKPTV